MLVVSASRNGNPCPITLGNFLQNVNNMKGRSILTHFGKQSPSEKSYLTQSEVFFHDYLIALLDKQLWIFLLPPNLFMFSFPQSGRVRHEHVSGSELSENQPTQLLVIRVLDGSNDIYHISQQLVGEFNLLSRPHLDLQVWLFEGIASGQILQEALHRSIRATDEVEATAGQILSPSPRQ